jgi:LuxR family transcriptional regulator, maltose regulon positive regulatory protein
MRPLAAQLGQVPARLSLVPASPVPREKIVAVGPGRTDAVAGRVVRAGAGGVVARPELFGRLGGAARVTVMTGPPGSGKTMLLRSWISQAGLSDRTAWVAAGRDERDLQHFWLSVVGALSRTTSGSALVQVLTPTPDLDGWAIVERLLSDLAPLREPVWLVVDDVHELGPQALRQLELLVMRAPPRLRFVLAARHDVRLGLHRLRLEGNLAEIRADDLRFSRAEAAELFAAAGLELPEPAMERLVERSEGWAAGLRMAALSLAGHPDPARFAQEFSGTERTVAEYLLAEVLDRQPEPVRRLLLRTSILGRVNGELADLLTGDEGGERVLQDLERANAFVVSLDATRSWFRYHQMFAGLLRLELRRTEPGALAAVHRAAAGWLAERGCAVEAVRHAQGARDWELAARLLADHWPGLHLDGQDSTVHELVAGFPPEARAAHAELAGLAAVDELTRGSLEAAERYLALAEQQSASVPQGRDGQFRVLLGVARLLHARQRGNSEAVAGEARRLQAAAEAPEAAQPHLGEDLHALALISLGSAETSAAWSEEAHRHLEQGVALARLVGRPFLEFTGLAELAQTELAGPPARTANPGRPLTRVAERARQVIELARRHGWTGEPAFGVACRVLGVSLAWQARPEEAEPWVRLGERTVSAEAEPGATAGVCYARGLLELARGRDRDALAAFQATERLAGRLDGPNLGVPRARAQQMLVLVRLGDTERAEHSLAGMEERQRERGAVRVATAALRLAQDDPRAAAAALAPVLDGSASELPWTWLIFVFLLEASVRDALGDQGAADRALERALDLAEPDGALLWFLLHPVPALVERQARHRTAHAALVAQILGLLAGPGGYGGMASPHERGGLGGSPPQLTEPLSGTELRVLRYLPTNLTTPEIAAELYVSRNTVKTHVRSLYLKLGTHRRAEAVEFARDLGLLAPSAHSPR